MRWCGLVGLGWEREYNSYYRILAETYSIIRIKQNEKGKREKKRRRLGEG